jgi:hypothetical protein
MVGQLKKLQIAFFCHLDQRERSFINGPVEKISPFGRNDMAEVGTKPVLSWSTSKPDKSSVAKLFDVDDRKVRHKAATPAMICKAAARKDSCADLY